MTQNKKQYTEFTLDNGLRVIYQRTAPQTVSARLRIFHGTLHENPGEEGIAHFLEHCVYTGGTQKYTPEQAKQIDSYLGKPNAGTGPSETQFPVKMLSEDIEVYLDFVSQVAFHPRLDLKKLEEERRRVLKETSNYKSGPRFLPGFKFRTAFYGANSQHNCNVLGDESVIQTASADDLRRFHARGYSPNNADLILVGSLPENLEELIKINFAKIPFGPGQKINYLPNKQIEKQKIMRLNAPDLINFEDVQKSSAELYLSMFASPDVDQKGPAICIMNSILGGSANSRLFDTISQRMGLAYGIGSDYDGENNQGVIKVGGKISAKDSEQVIDLVFSEMQKLRTELVDESELNVVRRKLKFQLADMEDSNQGRVGALELFLDEGITMAEYFSKMSMVSSEDVLEVAREFLPKSQEEGKYVLMLRDPLQE